ncbi:MAG: hypothetical protein P9L88_05375 [Candidatus Tantalella remota]|nr:hypothetical protein [Candidatus Tantalella remota]
MIKRILIGAAIGAAIGFGANYLCYLTGGTCLLMNDKLTSVLLGMFVGGLVGSVLGNE